MTATAAEVTPGVYDIPEDAYHADPVPVGSLSSSGARRLLASCPAVFMHEHLNPPAATPDMEFGTVAHRMVLGVGPEVVIVRANNWKTKAAQKKADDARARGAVPLLARDYQTVQEMAAALRRHPIAAALLDPGRGDAEQTLIWNDRGTGVWRRARLDFLPESTPGRMIVVDYKSTRSAHPSAIAKSVHQYGYHQQHAWYVDGVRELGLASDVAMIFLFQEKVPPYLVTPVELDANAIRIGRERNREALDLYRRCVETGNWPGYTDDIAYVSLPPWAESRSGGRA
jgi:hypothetical protein